MNEKDTIYQTGLWLDNQLGKLFEQYNIMDGLELKGDTLWVEEFDRREVIAHD
jgi:hypothetical protein